MSDPAADRASQRSWAATLEGAGVPVGQLKAKLAPALAALPVEKVKTALAPALAALPVEKVKTALAPALAALPVGQVKAKVDGALGGLPVEQVQTRVTDLADKRPEIAVGVAFAGGLLIAMIVRRLGG